MTSLEIERHPVRPSKGQRHAQRLVHTQHQHRPSCRSGLLHQTEEVTWVTMPKTPVTLFRNT